MNEGVEKRLGTLPEWSFLHREENFRRGKKHTLVPKCHQSIQVSAQSYPRANVTPKLGDWAVCIILRS